MSNKIDAEQFYIPWLYDLAILEKHLSDRSFRLSYSVRIPYADGSDMYVDDIPSPDLVFFLTYTHSYLEKGLKYLCLISDPQASYSHVAGYHHALQRAWKHLQRTPAAASLEKILRDSTLWDLFNAMLTLNHPGLRYLHVEKEVTVNIGQLPSLVSTFKEFLLLLRRDIVFSDPVVFPQLKALRTRVRASVPVSGEPPDSQRVDWEEWTLSIEPR